jgi:TP901 family phage tail tape measure protein
MREYFRFAGGATKTFGKLFKSEFDTIGKVADDRVKRLQTQYIKLGRDTSGVMKAIAIMPNQLDMSNFSTQSQIAAQKQAIFNQLVKQGSTNLLNFGKNTQWAGRQLMVGFTLPLATLGTVATRTFMEMEAQTIKFRKVYGDLFTPTEETNQALDNITALGQMFTKYGVAVSQTVGLAAEAAAAGFSGVDLQRQTTEATRLSVLGQIDSNKALETTISLQNAFKMSSENLASSIDFLNAVENQTVVSLDDITTAIPKVAPVIQQLGGDVKDLAFFMAAMKEGGINASEGANALKSGLAALINPTTKASAMLAGYGINIDKIIEGNQGDLKTTVVEFAQALDTLDPLTRARAIEQLFGKFQFARLSTLFDNVTNQSGQAARVLELAGTSIEDLSALSEKELGMTADSAMNKFRKSVEDLKLSLVPVGQTFLQAVTPIVEFIGGILERFNNLSDGVKKAIVVLTVAIGAIGPIALMTFGLLANGLANIVKGALVLRNGYLRLTGQTQILGEQTEYLTMEQIDAAAASHSLDQSHARLTQTFTAESSAVTQLIAAYQQATVAAAKFAAINPGLMRPPGAPTKRAKGKPIVVGGSGNQDTELALLTPGETVIPAEMSKRYGALINGMIAGNIPGYRRGLGSGDAEFAQSIAGVAPQRSQAGVQAFLERELKAVPEQLVQDFKDLVTTISQEVKLSETALKERLKAFRAQYNANIGQQEELQFAHLDTGRRVKAGELQSSGAVVDPRTQARLREFVDAAGADALVDLKTGFGVELTGFLNNAMQGAGASLEDAINDFKIGGVDKFRKSVEIGGGNMEDLGPELAAFDARFQQNLEEAYSQGARIIVDSQAQIEQMRQEALVKGETFDDTIYVAMDTVAEQTRQNVLELGSGLEAVFQEAMNTITEIRFQGLTPEQQAGLPAGYGRGSKGGRVTPGGTGTFRKRGGVGSFANAPLAQESVANVDAAIMATAQAAGTQSPSKKTIPIGEDIARGLQVGMANQKDEVAASGQALGTAAVSGTQSGRRAAFRAQGPAGTDTLTQSGGPRVRRRADRPQAPADLTLEQARQSAISPAMKDAIDKEVTARKTSAQKIDSMNRGLMAGTFALTSLAGAGSMAGGTIGNLSQQVMKFSGLLFALMSVTQLLTQAKVAQLVATRATTVATAMGGTGFKSLFSRGGGLLGFGKNLLTAGKFLLRFAGPIGLVTTGLIGLYSITKMINAAREKERQKLEAFSDVITVSTDKLKFLSEQFNFVPVKGSLETFGKDLERTSVVVRSAREELKASEGFQETYGQNIEQVRGMSDQQAETALSFMGLDLISQGMAKEQVQLLIDTIKEEAGKKDLKFDFKKLTFDEKGLKGLNSQFDVSIKEFANTAKNGFEKVFQQVAVGEGRAARLQIVERLVPNAEAKAAIKNAGALIGSYAESLNRLVTSGSIEAEEFTKVTDNMFASIAESAPDASLQIRIFNATLNAIDPALAKIVKGVKDLKDNQLLLKSAIAGVSANLIANAALAFRTAEALNKVAEANLKAFGVKDVTADQAATRGFANSNSVNARKLLNDAIKESIELQKELNKVQGKIGGDGSGTGKSPFQLAIEQLEKQQLELKNTKKAYDILTEAGFDAATATKYASDSVIALGLATGKISTTQLEQVKTLMEDIEKRAGSEAIKNFLDSLRTETNLKENFLGIAPSILAMGGTLKDVENILGNPTLMQSFVDPLATAEIKTKRIKDYLDAIRTGEAIDIKIDFLINPDKAKEELKKKADELFGFLERAAQREYKPKIINAEKEVKNAQDAVDKIQVRIDAIQDKIDLEQRNLETGITRKIEQYQEQVSDLQRTIEIQFDRPIEAIQNEISALERGIELDFERPLSALQETSSDLSNDLTLIDKQAESINQKYDAQAKALEDVANINQQILGQQKQQISLADALSQGDISAAAQIAQESRASSAEASSANAQNTLQAARQLELDRLRNVAGLTRKQIEEAQFKIGQQTFAIEEQREAVQARIQIKQDQIFALEQARQTNLIQIKGIEDSIYILEEQREAVLLTIRGYEDEIYNIKVKELEPALALLETAQNNLQVIKDELQARLDNIEAQRDAWQAAADAEMAAKILAGEYNDVLLKTIEYLNNILDLWKKIAAASKVDGGGGPTSSGGVTTTKTVQKSVAYSTCPSGKGLYIETYVDGKLTSSKFSACVTDTTDTTKTEDPITQAVNDAIKLNPGNGPDALYDQKLAKQAAENLLLVSKINPSALAAQESGAIGAASIAAQFTAAKAAANQASALSNFRAKEAADAAADARAAAAAATKGRVGRKYGGMIPKYLASGGFPRGTDTIPAMLSPGEFVMSKYAVNSYGVDKMKAINSGSYEGEKVYNYNLSVNVKSDADPDDIARVVMTQIRQIDSQRIRTQRA